MNYNLSQIGFKVKKIRQENNISQIQLSKKLNIHRTTISAIERNAQIPSTEFIIKFCFYFKISANYILSLDNVHSHNEVHNVELYPENYISIEHLNISQAKHLKAFVESLNTELSN